MIIETEEEKQAIYLEWVNNFLTVERFAEYYSLTIDEAEELIKTGREAHENIVRNSN